MAKKTCCIIGYGSIGHSWERSIKKHPDWELIGIIDTDTELLENVAKKGPVAEDQVFSSIEEQVQFGQKPDMAIVATPIYYHNSITREVMDLDINVICEKNMASTLYEGRQMVQYAKDRPHLCTAVDTQYRYSGNYWAARQFFKKGADCAIGKLGMIKWESADYRGEKRWAWRRALPDVYLEDMSVHWFDTLRYTTSMDIVQVKADVFMPNYSDWHGSSEVYANLALAKPEDHNNRHNWVWAQFYGGWQRNGPTYNDYRYFGGKGQAIVNAWGLDLRLYPDKSDTRKVEEDGFLPIDAGPVEGQQYTGQEAILEMMSKGIDSKGKKQPGTNFCEAFKSFAVSIACSESSRYGKTVWVPDYWKGLLD